MSLKGFIQPKAIAVIGASKNPSKIGFNVLKNIIDGGFKGKIFPINLDTDEIIGYKCYPSVLRVPHTIDLAVIVVPSQVVSSVLIECGKKKIENVIIISAGFAESGWEGKKRQEELERISSLYHINILGPNCLGVIDPVNDLNISFATNMPKEKNIALVSQSGATGTAILDWANQNGIGFSHFVSLGNKIDLDENDFLEYFLKDKKTKIVLAYLESFSDGERLIKIAKEITKEKPLVIMKAGRSSWGQKAASSHTGALAEDDLVVTTALEEAGVIRAETLEDFFEFANVFSNLEARKNSKTLIITNAGGPGVMTADAMAKSSHLKFYQLEKEDSQFLKKNLKCDATLNNPLDLLGDATSQRFELALDRIASRPDYKVIVLTPQVNTDIENIAKLIVEKKDKRTLVVLIGGNKFIEAKKILAKAEVPVFDYPERAVKALETFAAFGGYSNKEKSKETFVSGYSKVVHKVLKHKVELNDADIAKILTAYHIPMADSFLTTNANEAISAAEKIGYPVVLKVTSPDILHKTEVGAIKLGIENEKSLRESYQEVLKNARKHFPKAKILGVTVYKMVRSKVEVALGAKRDPVFGPVIMFGLGGIYIELLKDYRLGIAPVSVERAEEMIRSIKSYELLNGYRKGELFDIQAIAKAISGLSALMEDFPQINELDINPLRVGTRGEGVLALDAKIILQKEEVLV